ncbi:MAG: toll/interleukin-1 receptor domain-containing protein [Acidobacteriota bacterium]
MSKPTVFISYSHKDEEWKDRLVTHLDVLQRQGLLSVWQDRLINAGDAWGPEIQKAMDEASLAMLLVSPPVLTSDFIRNRELPYLLEQREERGLRIFPVIVEPFDLGAVDWLRHLQCRPKDAVPLSTFARTEAEQLLADIAKEIRMLLAGARPQPGGTIPVAPPEIAVANLPTTGELLVGRDLELELLDGAWADPDTHLISLVAFGGVGKSALVNHWLDRIRQRGWDGAERVFGWSFYSQGTRDDKMASADSFIHSVLRWFGDPDPASGTPWEKGERLD